jgi:4-amino-4-deoxy-L-arabinose transferase-like glycosyltransferase
VGLLLRVPFVFPAVIDWDESTFVLIGQSLVDGHLPYVELWALKPPLAFAFFGLVIALFGKTLVAIRLAGAICVVVTAFLVYLIASRLSNRRVGLVAGILTVTTVSLLPSGQATMTEHVALVPLTAALWLLIRKEPSVRTYFVAGVLLSVATLVRLNMAYVAILVGLSVAMVRGERAPLRAVQYAGAYAAGGALIVALTWLPYFLMNEQALWWASVVAAPLNYAGKSSIGANLVTHSMTALGLSNDGRGLRFHGSLLITFVSLATAGGVAVLARRWNARQAEGPGIVLLALFMTGIGLGILTSGDPYGHHLIQLAPFAAMLAAMCVDHFSGFVRLALLVYMGALMVVSIGPVAAEYRAAISRALAHQALRYGAAYEIAAYLKQENPSRRPVYLMSDHIAYWFADLRPPTKLTTHPSNIGEQSLIDAVVGEGASTSEELRKVFRQKPAFVVVPERVFYLQPEPMRLLENILSAEYVLVTQIQGRKIYRMRSAATIDVA